MENNPDTAANPKGTARTWRDTAVIVTGAGSGVGLATCAGFAQAEANLVLVGRNDARLAQAVQTLGLPEARVLCVAGDVGDSAFCRAVCEAAAARFGAIGALVNNAGLIARASTEQTDDAAWRAVMRTNADGVFYMMRSALPLLRKSQGAIVNVASTCGMVGAGNLIAYCASKGAVIQMTRAAALDEAKTGVTINAVCPGAIESPMLFSAHADSPDDSDVRARNAAAIPQGKIAEAQEVARAILYLAGERHITGTTLAVDGGYLAQ